MCAGERETVAARNEVEEMVAIRAISSTSLRLIVARRLVGPPVCQRRVSRSVQASGPLSR
ncbi:hypothetical protein GCM10022262_02860 [Georgenia daeguensis]|uniref:Uncharacterized protein n=1 Tax=Georgenia daeguensis TaxID=908355 RepID=A0ABP8EPQ6_9MICO